jgi:hypothetical protein
MVRIRRHIGKDFGKHFGKHFGKDVRYCKKEKTNWLRQGSFLNRIRLLLRYEVQIRYGKKDKIKLLRQGSFLNRIRFLLQYGEQIKAMRPFDNKKEFTVLSFYGIFKLVCTKVSLASLESRRKTDPKVTVKNIKYKHNNLCLDMEWNGYLYTGFKWENGWPTEAGSNTITGPASPGTSTPAAVDTAPALAADAAAAPVHPPVSSGALSPPSPRMDTTPLASFATTGHLPQHPDIGIQVKSQEPHSQEEKVDAESSYTGTSYITSQVSDESEDETDDRSTTSHGQVDLGSGYVQCRAAREAGSVGRVVDISCNENVMSAEEKKADRIGTLENSLDPDIKNCFKGARIEKNGNVVNQFMSCSFDPSTLLCITCNREHKVLEGEGGPDCFVLYDQNFIGTLPGTEQKKCLHITRIENASLNELAGIFLEIMDGKTLKQGTCILVGSLSYLSRVGVSAYAAEWRTCVHMLTSRWAGISVCPLFPIHVSELPGHLFGELLKLHSWFRTVYTGKTNGLSSCWDKFSDSLREFSEGAGSLDFPEVCSPLLPANMDISSMLLPVRFSTSSTSPTIILGFDRKTVHELLLSLTTSLRRGFSIHINPEAVLAREPMSNCEGAKESGQASFTIILAGASNLGRLKPIFEANGATVIDLTKPGWMATAPNIESLKNELSAFTDTENCAVIFDVFGNSAFKFKHVDGTLVLPFRMAEGGYHFLGDISLDSDRNIGELIELVRPLFVLACKLLTVILPPQPRYVFCGCCMDKSHGTNVGEAGYSSQILEATLHFRKLLKTTLVGQEDLGQFWLMETLGFPPLWRKNLNFCATASARTVST